MGLNWRMRTDLQTDDPKIVFGSNGAHLLFDNESVSEFMENKFGIDADEVQWREQVLEYGFMFEGVVDISENDRWEFFLVSLNE